MIITEGSATRILLAFILAFLPRVDAGQLLELLSTVLFRALPLSTGLAVTDRISGEEVSGTFELDRRVPLQVFGLFLEERTGPFGDIRSGSPRPHLPVPPGERLALQISAATGLAITRTPDELQGPIIVPIIGIYAITRSDLALVSTTAGLKVFFLRGSFFDSILAFRFTLRFGLTHSLRFHFSFLIPRIVFSDQHLRRLILRCMLLQQRDSYGHLHEVNPQKQESEQHVGSLQHGRGVVRY